MKIALIQINPTIGDFQANAEKILAQARRARERGADLAIFSEMCLCGYPPRDLLERPAFTARNLTALEDLAARAPALPILVGYVARREEAEGKALHNAAALIHNGRIASRHYKSLLPTYDVFDEARYFAPAAQVQPARVAGHAIGVTICEDIWNDEDFWPRRLYQADPVKALIAAGAEFIVNLSASPYSVGKHRLRREMICAEARRHRCPFIYVNQVGGNDDLLFDGASLAVDASGTVLAQAADFVEDLVLVDLEAGTGDLHPVSDSDVASVHKALVLGIGDYLAKCGFQRAVVGLSGGIDSAVTACLAAEALGPENVRGISMPSRYSSAGSRNDAAAVAKALGIRYEQIPIEPIFAAQLASLAPLFAGRPPDVAEENLQARIRGALLMAVSNKFGCLTLATGNKSELAVGYCTLYGDMCGGLAVISDVPKTMVYALARHINRQDEIVPRATLEKPPSAELRPDQKDTDALPPYEVLDGILVRFVEQGLSVDQIVAEGCERAVVEQIVRKVYLNEYKRGQAAPGLRVTSKAFGYGRRYPIAQRFRS